MPTKQGAVSELVDKLVGVLMEIDEAMKQASRESVEEACVGLAEVHRAKTEMSVVYDSAVHVVAEKMADLPEVTLSDGTKLEKKSAYERKSWRHEELVDIVAKRIVQLSTNLDTGEVDATPESVAKEMLKFFQPSYWRVKELSKIGVTADEYCDVSEESKTSVIVRRPKQ